LLHLFFSALEEIYFPQIESNSPPEGWFFSTILHTNFPGFSCCKATFTMSQHSLPEEQVFPGEIVARCDLSKTSSAHTIPLAVPMSGQFLRFLWFPGMKFRKVNELIWIIRHKN